MLQDNTGQPEKTAGKYQDSESESNSSDNDEGLTIDEALWKQLFLLKEEETKEVTNLNISSLSVVTFESFLAFRNAGNLVPHL